MAQYDDNTDSLPEATPTVTLKQDDILSETAADFSQPAPSAPPPPVPPAQPTAPQPVYAAPQPQPEPRRVRRVGSITSGLALIAGGVLLCLAMFRPSYHILFTALKFTPVFIILLGIEILLSRIGSDHVRLKYDFLSVVMVFLVFLAAGAAACVPILLEYYGPEFQNLPAVFEKEVDRRLHEQLQSVPGVDHTQTDVYLNYFSGDKENRTLDDLAANDTVQTTITLQGDFADAAAFAKACEPVVAGVKAANISQLDRIYLSSSQINTDKLYTLDLSGLYRMDKTAAEWTPLVEEQFYIEGYGGYGTAKDKAEYEQSELDTAQELAQQQEEERQALQQEYDNLQQEREEFETQRAQMQEELDRQQEEIDRQRNELENQAA